MRSELVLAALSMSLSLIAGCTQSTGEAAMASSGSAVSTGRSDPVEVSVTSGQTSASQTAVKNQLWIALPRQLQLPGLANVKAAPSWNARIAEFPTIDQEYLIDVNQHYFGSLEFQTEEEQRRLIQQGFPMPEEWLAARNLLDTELERLAQEKNLKAQMFWINRTAQKIGPILAAGKGLGNSPADKELFRRFTEARLMADNLLRNTRSPFAAYLSGRIAAAGSFGTPPALVAGSFQLAKELGDERADNYMRRFSQAHPRMDAETVMVSYAGMKAATER